MPTKHSLSVGDASSTSALSSQIDALQKSAASWNSWYLLFVFGAALFGALAFVFQWRTNTLQERLSDAQQLLLQEKDKTLRADLKDKDAEIAGAKRDASAADARAGEAKERASKADESASKANLRAEQLERENLATRGQVATLEKGAAEANTELSRQRERTAQAELALAEMQRKMSDRRLRAEQSVALGTLLSGREFGRISMFPTGLDPETRGYCRDFAAALKQSGWTFESENPCSVVWTGTAKGIVIWVRDAGKPPSRAVVLQEALESVLGEHIPIADTSHGALGGADRPADFVGLIIGSKK